ncbi:hypothetical protein M5K25_018899 [Dendrobium thyrsiflorum]|uniref:HAT C-terminal dimerisation domain-containing protein n=1 Tax=Dendrobium thyrsiflorum TaxID=117978 RepID=A0ABD0UDD0_DENTH
MKKSTTAKHLQQEQFDDRVKHGSYYGSESGKGSSSIIHSRGARGPMDQYMRTNTDDACGWYQRGSTSGFAVRVLGLTCSSSGCERNWSTYSQVQTKRRNRLSTLRMNSVVYIMHNKRLRDRRLRNKGLKDDEDPLVCEDAASDNEWFIDDETDLPLSDLQLEDLSVDVLRGEADQGGTSTSATPHTSTSSAAQQRKVGNIEDDEDLTFINTIGEEDSLEDPFSDGT